jgi:hypothetical protein
MVIVINQIGELGTDWRQLGVGKVNSKACAACWFAAMPLGCASGRLVRFPRWRRVPTSALLVDIAIPSRSVMLGGTDLAGEVRCVIYRA